MLMKFYHICLSPYYKANKSYFLLSMIIFRLFQYFINETIFLSNFTNDSIMKLKGASLIGTVILSNTSYSISRLSLIFKLKVTIGIGKQSRGCYKLGFYYSQNNIGLSIICRKWLFLNISMLNA